MDYRSAAKIRKKSFGSLLAEQEGGLLSSIGSAISSKTRANITGIKETFDPMNIAKKMTFGSNWAPAMMGKMTGRKQSDIAHFTGARPSGVGRSAAVQDGDSENKPVNPIIESVKGIERIIKEREKQIAKWNKEDDKEDKRENKVEQKRHEQILKALTLKRVPKKVGRPKKIEEPKKPGEPAKPAEKPAAQKPAEKPAAQKPAEKPAAQKPAEKPAQKQQTDKAAKDKADREAKDKADREAKDKAAKDKADREAKDKADREAKDKSQKEAKDKADKEAKDAKDKADRESKQAKDKADKEAKDAKDKADREAKETKDKADKETATRQKKEAEKPAQQQQPTAQPAPKQQTQPPAQQAPAQPAPAAPKPSADKIITKGLDATGKATSKGSFVGAMNPVAQMVSQKLGGKIQPAALLAQWGLETGDGKSLVAPFNYGNIKATKAQKDAGQVGGFVTVEEAYTPKQLEAIKAGKTLEEFVQVIGPDDKLIQRKGQFYTVDGWYGKGQYANAQAAGKQWAQVKSFFAKYESPEDFGNAFAKLLSNPRYKEALEKGDIGEYAKTVGAAGYHTAGVDKYAASVTKTASEYTQLLNQQGSQIGQASQQNTQMRNELNKDTPTPTNVNNTTVNQSNQMPPSGSTRPDDRPAPVKKADKK